MANDNSNALRLFTQLNGLDDLPHLHYVARSIIRNQKFIIYLLSVLRFLISNSLNELRVHRDWLQLKPTNMTVSIFEIDQLIKNPAFLFRFSKQNYNYWLTKFNSTCSVPIHLFSFKNQSDIEMQEWDNSLDLSPICPHLHSLKDTFKKLLYHYRYSSWIKKPNYNPKVILEKYFNNEFTPSLEIELQLSPMWMQFVGDTSVNFIDSASAIVTGYYTDGSPSQYLQNKINQTRDIDYSNAVNSSHHKTRNSYKLSYLNAFGAHILNYRSVPLVNVSFGEETSEHYSDRSSLSSSNAEDNTNAPANIEFYKPPLLETPVTQNYNDENQQLFGW